MKAYWKGVVPDANFEVQRRWSKEWSEASKRRHFGNVSERYFHSFVPSTVDRRDDEKNQKNIKGKINKPRIAEDGYRSSNFLVVFISVRREGCCFKLGSSILYCFSKFHLIYSPRIRGSPPPPCCSRTSFIKSGSTFRMPSASL